ncbi:YcnI family protein [Desertibaculum subflavum]|uniref:YcnI family protein n=1 Tax=Desertibaculum subflavum TaxID=2268458 RepID=UPI000E66992A
MTPIIRIAALTAALTAPAVGQAHIVAEPNEGPAGGYFRTAFRIPHGCAGSATIAVTITLPPGTLAVKPQAKPGWAITLTKRPVDLPVPGGHGTTITETVDTVTWRGGPLPNEHFDEFGLSLKLPAGPAGATLWFATVQQCERGESRWVEIPAEGQKWGDLKAPAPFVRLRAAPATHQH